MIKSRTRVEGKKTGLFYFQFVTGNEPTKKYASTSLPVDAFVRNLDKVSKWIDEGHLFYVDMKVKIWKPKKKKNERKAKTVPGKAGRKLSKKG